MKLKAFIAAAAIALMPAVASTATLSPGTYDVVDYNDSRSIWTPRASGNRLVTGNNASRLWTFSQSTFSFDGSTATMSGLATNGVAGSTNTDLQFTFNLEFDLIANPGNDRYCQQAGHVNNTCSSVGVKTSDFTYFDLTSGTLTGVAGTSLQNVEWSITQRSQHGPQVGDGANALDFDFGFSMWFNFDRTSGPSGANGYTFNRDGYGDFNNDLTNFQSNISPVPLPAGGMLLIAALGGMALVRRRRT